MAENRGRLSSHPHPHPVGSRCRAGNPEASEFYFKGKGRILMVFSAPLAAIWDKAAGGKHRSEAPGGDGPEHPAAIAGGEEYG